MFSPEGDIIDLPAGSTPVDFAYRIHTELGHRTIGAKVNGIMVPLDTQLQTGDRVEILTTKTANGPGRDWLNFVRTANARAKDPPMVQAPGPRGEHRPRPRDAGARAAEAGSRQTERIRPGSAGRTGRRAQACAAPDDLLRSSDTAQLTPSRCSPVWACCRWRRSRSRWRRRRAVPSSGEVAVMGVGDLLTRLASCCLPAPGDADHRLYHAQSRGDGAPQTTARASRRRRRQERLVHGGLGAAR